MSGLRDLLDLDEPDRWFGIDQSKEARRIEAQVHKEMQQVYSLGRMCLDALSPKQLRVVELRYGFYDEPMTLKRVGDLMKLSPERIRALQAQAIGKARRVLHKLDGARFIRLQKSKPERDFLLDAFGWPMDVYGHPVKE